MWGSVIGAGIGAMTGRRDNKQAAKAARREMDWTRELQEDAQAFEAQQAASAMAFSERMANTQHQREVSDLRAAGLNPILSGTGGMGSAAPSGVAGHSSASKPPSQQIIPTSAAVASGAATGMQIERQMAEIKNIEADTRNKDAQNPGFAIVQRQAEAETDRIMADTDFKRELSKKTVEEQALVREQINKALVDIRLSGLQGDSEIERARQYKASTALSYEQAGLAGVERRTAEGIEKIGVNELLKAAPALAPYASILKSILMPSKGITINK